MKKGFLFVLVLALVSGMCLSFMPTPALATDTDDQTTASVATGNTTGTEHALETGVNILKTGVSDETFNIGKDQVLMISGQGLEEPIRFENCTFNLASGTVRISGNQDGMRNVSQKNMKLVKLPIPKFEEQKEIVSILSDLLAKEEQAKGAAEEVLEQINLIKKAILDRAFRGELGTNDPSEESAIKLLERSFSETIESEKVSHKQVSKQKAEVVFVPKTIMEALSTGVRLTPENLKRETELPIDDFYARLKELIDNGSVVESRENGESYLEAANENRQAENQRL